MFTFRVLKRYNVKIVLYFIFLSYLLFVVLAFPILNSNSIFSFNIPEDKEALKVYIIGKAAIGQYLWEHLIRGNVTHFSNGFYQNGNITFHNINFIYLSGPGFIQNSIPQEIEYMVLVLNGRDYKKVKKAKEWLDYLPSMNYLKRVAVVLLGDEKCENEWVLNFMKSRGGVIDVLFLVYDSDIIDDKEIFQWPLGVATYRGFPHANGQNMEQILHKRNYLCNFIGTVYKNSSREFLNSILQMPQFTNKCYVQARDRWVPEESNSSLQLYIKVLQDSDFTLCPVGVNTECYRIYESFSFGSVPVIEDKMTPGKCVSPLRLLKKYNAPVIYLKNWNSLGKTLDHEIQNFNSTIERRKKVLIWYKHFKNSVIVHFITVLKNVFLAH